MKDLSFQFDSDPCPQNDPNQGYLMGPIAAAADPPVAFRNFDHLVLVEPYTGCCLRGPSDIGICGGGYKKAESGTRLSQWLYQELMQTLFRFLLLLLLMN